MSMPTPRQWLVPWIDEGQVPPQSVGSALRRSGVSPDASAWRRFLERLMLVVGSLGLAVAAVFFVAHNWSALGRFFRFGLIETALVLCTLAYWRLDPNRLSAKMALTSAVILLGVLLAYFGQTYQTGADPWQLFATWAVLMLPWALLGRFAPIWLLWLGLLNLSVALYALTWLSAFGVLFSAQTDLAWMLWGLNTAAWVAWEGLTPRYPWLGGRWPVRCIALASGFAATSIALQGIFDSQVPWLLGWLLYGGWLVAVVAVYQRRIPDQFMLAGAALTVIIVVTAQLIDWLWDAMGDGTSLAFLSLAVIGQGALAARWLQKIHAEHSQ